MISYQGFIKSFPFPSLILDLDNQVVCCQEEGALFPLPNDFALSRLLMHAKTSNQGWSECPNGYACYIRPVAELGGFKFVVFGLKVHDVSSAKGRTNGLSIKSNKSDIVHLVDSFFESYSETEKSFKDFIKLNLHEVRQINTDIYHNAYELEENKRLSDKQKSSKAKDIATLSSLLTARLDYLEFLSNPIIIQSAKTGEIEPYKVFDKLMRSLNTSANYKKVSLDIGGTAAGKIRATQLFSVIPYLLLENAIKYSPRRGTAKITFDENRDKVFVSVSSLGPKLAHGEEKKIFKDGYRGTYAQSYELDGSGKGLYALKSLVELQDGGHISVAQDQGCSYQSGNMQYFQTSFNLEFNRVL